MTKGARSARLSRELERTLHRPKFRSIAAFGMIVTFATGVVAAVVTVWVGLRDALIMMNIIQPSASPSEPPESFGALAWLWASLTRHTFLIAAMAAVAWFICAYLLRRIVLHGLRD